MNLYEHTIIARQDTSPGELKQLTDKYSKIIEKNNGEVIKTENWGLLNLSYLIKKNRKGSYIHFKIKGKGDVINELEKNESIDKKKFNNIGINFKKNKPIRKKQKNKNIVDTKKKIKLGVFYDKSFGFYYSDDIENFKKYGAEIILINSVKSKNLPKIDALFIGGGFPETNALIMKKNKSLMKDVREFIELEKPCYAECGGLMYLSESINYKNKKHKMVGAIPGNIIMSKKPIGRGYVKLKIKKKHLWGMKDNNIINAHEFHHANLLLNNNATNYAYNVERGFGINGICDGLQYKNLLANFSHLRHTKKYPWIKYFVNFIKERKND